jgi:hypothetical protein
VAGRDQRDLAGQVGGMQVDAHDDTCAGGMLAKQRRRAFVVLGPDLAGECLDPYRRLPRLGVAERQHDDHFVGPQCPPFKTRIVRQPGRRIRDRGYIEFPAHDPFVQLPGQAGQQAPRKRPGLVEQAAHSGGHDPGGQ